MMGNLHVFRIGAREGTYDRRITEYQINYSAAGKTYTRIIEEPELVAFFRDDMAMDEATTKEAISELRTSGQSTIGGLELSENDTNELGLLQSPSDI